MTDTIALEHKLLDAGISKRDYAKCLGISEMALFNKLKNISEFKASEIVKTAALLNLDTYTRDAIFFNIKCD